MEEKPMYMGVDYYPEHWPADMMDEDIKRMKQMGVNMVRIGEFLKTGNRPSKGRRTFVFWNKYKKDSPLPASGLLGPVVLSAAVDR